jgi:PAS domain S-box-containing protein
MRKLLFDSLASAADGAFVVDEDQRILYWNQAAQRVLGYTSEETLGRLCYELMEGQDEQGRAICRKHCRLMVIAFGGGQIPTHDLSVRGSAGDPCWINVSAFVFRGNGQDPEPVLVHLFRNVTHRKENEQLLREVLTAAGRLQNGQPSPRRPREPKVDEGTDLTDREREVLSLLATGSSTADMAQALCISTSTVRNHVRSILSKFGVHSRLEAVVYALKQGLITLD